MSPAVQDYQLWMGLEQLFAGLEAVAGCIRAECRDYDLKRPVISV
jgi:hypothetical protein